MSLKYIYSSLARSEPTHRCASNAPMSPAHVRICHKTKASKRNFLLHPLPQDWAGVCVCGYNRTLYYVSVALRYCTSATSTLFVSIRKAIFPNSTGNSAPLKKAFHQVLLVLQACTHLCHNVPQTRSSGTGQSCPRQQSHIFDFVQQRLAIV